MGVTGRHSISHLISVSEFQHDVAVMEMDMDLNNFHLTPATKWQQLLIHCVQNSRGKSLADHDHDDSLRL